MASRWQVRDSNKSKTLRFVGFSVHRARGSVKPKRNDLLEQPDEIIRAVRLLVESTGAQVIAGSNVGLQI